MIDIRRNEMRTKSYGQDYNPTLIDKLGCWLSVMKIKKERRGGKLLDVGAGFHMTLSAQMIDEYEVTAVDISLNQQILPQIIKIEGQIERVLPRLPEYEYDFIIFNSVMEHLRDPQDMLSEIYRILKPDGIMFLNVPTWTGKWFLELSAFKFHTSPASEMNDHKMYYNKHSLWPMLVRAGFLPEHIRLRYHKFGLNVYAVCRKSKD